MIASLNKWNSSCIYICVCIIFKAFGKGSDFQYSTYINWLDELSVFDFKFGPDIFLIYLPLAEQVSRCTRLHFVAGFFAEDGCTSFPTDTSDPGTFER